MIPPSEIMMVNLEGGIICARLTQRDRHPITGALQYRVMMPDGSPTMIVTDVPVAQLREHVRTGKPVLFKPIE